MCVCMCVCEALTKGKDKFGGERGKMCRDSKVWQDLSVLLVRRHMRPILIFYSATIKIPATMSSSNTK